jgi:TolB-like protein
MAQQFLFGPFVLDTARGMLTRDGATVPVGNRAVRVLEALVRAGGQVVTKEELMAAAWPGAVVEESNLSVQVAALRKALGSMPEARQWIATVARLGYRFVGPVSAEESPAPASAGALADFGDRPALAVLPFLNLSGDAGQDYFVDGTTEDLINTLSRFRWFRVLGRNPSFSLKARQVDFGQAARQLGVRYVVEGSVRKSGDRVRIAAQLSDAASGRQIWSDRYDLPLADLFTVQDEIAERVAGAIEPELLKSESVLAMRRPRSGNLTAWDLVRQGMHSFHRVERETHMRAHELFRQATERDPELPDAWLWLARVDAGLVAYGWSSNRDAHLREGLAAAYRAIALDEKSPYAHYSLAIVSAYAGEFAQAARAAQRCLQINPGFALGHLVLGMARLFSGQAAEAIGPLERGLSLNPYDPQNFVWHNLLAFAHFFAGQPAKALESADRARSIRPGWRPGLELIACCHGSLGDPKAAREALQELERAPVVSDALLEPLRRENPRWMQKISASLDLARLSAPADRA